MFFPEHLLSRNGALARVWLAANLEKKLSKNQVLQDKINDDIAMIVKPDVAAGGPLALRLSGQLLLGVVRIYSRKARYLLDDCTEALIKIKMTFKPGNIDLPQGQSHVANPATLTLPDVITDIDLLAPMPDPALLFSQQMPELANLGGDDLAVPDWDNSQFLSGSIEQPRAEPMMLEDADDLNLDYGDEPLGYDEGTSIERGRDAPLERRLSDEFASSPKALADDDLGLDFGDDDFSALPGAGNNDLDLGMDIDMGGMTDLGAPGEITVQDMPALPVRERDSISPLSSIRSSVERDLEQTFNQGQTAYEPQQEEESVHQAQRAKRRKLLQADAETQIPNSQIREQQTDRSKILKASSFLPRDRVLLALMTMQKSGGFVSSILSDGRSRGWAPELRGIFSMELVSRPGQKRKRDSGIADVGSEEEATPGAEAVPQLEFDQSEGDLGLGDLGAGIGEHSSLVPDDETMQLPEDEGIAPPEDDFEEEYPADNFDDTTAPLLHPAESGAISIGTKHAVHMLRERFPAEAETDESVRQNNSLLFQDMLPEATTSRSDATKMFFEVLVLATKDAIKVEQPVHELGGPLRIRGKRGLYGSWAETSAGGEIASQSARGSPAPAVVASE